MHISSSIALPGETQGDVALVSLVHIRLGVKAHCNGQACSNTFEVHAWQSDSAVEDHRAALHVKA